MGNSCRKETPITEDKLRRRTALTKQHSKTINANYSNDVKTLEPEYVVRIDKDYLSYKGKIFRIYP